MTQQYAVLATALRVPAKMWPVDRKAFWECWGRMMETLTIMPPAIAVGNDLLYNQRLLIWARISMPVLRLLTTVLLPLVYVTCIVLRCRRHDTEHIES